MSDLQDILTTIGLILALVGTAYSIVQGRQKGKAEAQKIISEAENFEVDVAGKYQKMAAEQAGINIKNAAEIRLIKTQLAESEEYINALDTWAAEVLIVLKQLGITIARPKPERKRAVQ